jgi:hypothetical protein
VLRRLDEEDRVGTLLILQAVKHRVQVAQGSARGR